MALITAYGKANNEYFSRCSFTRYEVSGTDYDGYYCEIAWFTCNTFNIYKIHEAIDYICASNSKCKNGADLIVIRYFESNELERIIVKEIEKYLKKYYPSIPYILTGHFDSNIKVYIPDH